LKAIIERDFLELLLKHEGIIHKICRVYATDSLAKEDLFQEIVIQLWKSFEHFRNESKISTWMYRIALNTALTDQRKSKKRVALSFIGTFNEDKADENEAAIDQDNLNLLYCAIGKLSEIDKAIVMLYLEDKSYEEMEEIIGISQSTLRVKMNRIKEKLRQITKSNQYGT
jgi:RNA polymerase sigma factor (sigma-70 family)